MTKGWSRYVRDKRLAAGDTVSFCRDGARLYIDCRRRGNNNNNTSNNREVQQQQELVVVDEDVARRRPAEPTRLLRLFGVDLELRAAEPLLLDLQL
ncbi:hypothetical protein PR202_ga18386 [Eleusine coracana subsp. coracana]|uniref:TF-B3 domain-containing protein n=1 Tax=Eleusine coracana subsp. coracana TaxID=191504 RepID=A0AAV5CSY3_ELECO|nr:hypothetical protein PR202_ga18386 [Eleusine coracana subsp. coracana]